MVQLTMEMEKVLLAYSGGLDTSCILKWLIQKGFDVICFVGDVGQKEDFQSVKDKAIKIGATEVVVKDLRNLFVEHFVWPAVKMGLIYEKRYLLGTALARPCISLALIETAKEFNCMYISHGATGKGNDQIRFELSCYALNPHLKVIAPWRLPEFCEKFQGRNDLMEFAKVNAIPVSASLKSPWSTDSNIMHTSFEAGVLEDPAQIAPDEIFISTKSPMKAPDTPILIEIVFNGGVPIRCVETSTGKTFEQPLHILEYLNQIGGEHGIGRVDIVENRFIGLKSRGVYETPGARILFEAHQDLEIYCLDREILRVKSLLADRMADYVYNGFWFSPEAEYVKHCVEESQRTVNGRVTVEIFKGNCWAVSRESLYSLYNQELASMSVHGQLNPSAATGFIEINAIRLKEHYRAYHNATPNNIKGLSRNFSRVKLT
ncbi:CLUMA_CG004897, isoform A [Clunio marinus]|uniref:Argininosuccinate synthase n=1 Tax=Clunio marinus TaxID=568069 RepID=A0A1J1HXG2_9DIPT|nr:CLUMA_CG004897, isoform A [Clunio marinus]